MTPKRLAAVLVLFGLLVIGSGLYRYLTDSAGQNGLYFGLFAGGIALVGAVLAALNLTLAGRIVAGAAVALVVLWFSYDMYKDLSRNFTITGTEIRKAFLIICGIITAVAIGWRVRKTP